MFIGIDLGGTNLAVGIVADGKIINKISIKTPKNTEEIVNQMQFQCLEICKETEIPFEQIKGIGIACPGMIDSVSGIIKASSNLSFKNYPIVDVLSQKLQHPVRIYNDAGCAALAENIWGSSKGFGTSIMFTIGTGLGAGVIINGKLYTGKGGVAPELGHCVIIKDGIQCNCGLKGCCECYTAATALKRQTSEAAQFDVESKIHELCEGDLSKIAGDTAFKAANLGDQTAIKVVENYINYLAVTITNYINIFRPEVILIGGGVSNEGDGLFIPLNKKIRKIATTHVYGKDIPQVVKASMGNDAGIFGASALFIYEI